MLPNVAANANCVATALTPLFSVWSSTSSQINSQVFGFSSVAVAITIQTFGWIDRCGKDG
jgi:hypothetical protein